MEKRLTPDIINTLLDTIEKNFKESGDTVTDDALLSLYAIFDNILYSALELVETNAVFVIKLNNCPSSTFDVLLQVMSKRGYSYELFYRINYCRCVFYQQKVLQEKAYLTCKHVIAAHLAYIWEKYRVIDMEFAQDYNKFKDYLLHPSESESK